MSTTERQRKLRGICPVCGADWSLRSDGTLFRHYNHAIGASEETNWRIPVCMGTHSQPASQVPQSELDRLRDCVARVKALADSWALRAADEMLANPLDRDVLTDANDSLRYALAVRSALQGSS